MFLVRKLLFYRCILAEVANKLFQVFFLIQSGHRSEPSINTTTPTTTNGLPPSIPTGTTTTATAPMTTTSTALSAPFNVPPSNNNNNHSFHQNGKSAVSRGRGEHSWEEDMSQTSSTSGYRENCSLVMAAPPLSPDSSSHSQHSLLLVFEEDTLI